VRSAEPLATTSTAPATPTFANDPLNGATWTQHAGELDQLVGQVTVTTPPVAGCSAKTGPETTVLVQILLDGKVVGGAVALPGQTTLALTWRPSSPEAGSFNQPKQLEEPLAAPSPWLYEPSSDTPHTITARVADDCGAEGGKSGEHPTIDSISIDVLGVS
jgi:hypothetical protein